MGWSYSSTIGIVSGTQNFSPKKKSYGPGKRYVEFKQWLDETLATMVNIDHVYFEKVIAHKGTLAAHVYGGFLSILQAWCEEKGIPIEGIPVGTIKKHCAGIGNAKKHQMIACIEKKGFSPKDDNEADALALLMYAQNKMCLSY